MIWEAELADETLCEHDFRIGSRGSLYLDLGGSPWTQLQDFCERHDEPIKGLALVHGNDRYEAKPDADGYWYARGSWVNMNTNEQVDRYGIGWVSEGVLFIMWVVKTGASWKTTTERRDPSTQKQIIWSRLPE